jgi:hypothetical protein
MASVVIAGDVSGTCTLQAANAAGTTVLSLPTASGSLVSTGGAQTIEFGDGSAAAPSITNSGDTNTGMFFPAADTIAFTEGGVESMRIDSSGNVGIGTTSPTGKLEVTGGQLRVTASSASSMFLVNPSTTYADGVDIQATYNGAGSFGPLKFTTSSTERMRIDSSGNLCINTTSNSNTAAVVEIQAKTGQAGLAINGVSGQNVNLALRGISGGLAGITSNTTIYFAPSNVEAMRIDSSGSLLINRTSPANSERLGVTGNVGSQCMSMTSPITGAYDMCNIINGNGQVGLIQTNGSGTSYITSSDYRLKENVAPMTGALAKVALLKPCTYTWKIDGSDGQGFIAHELQAVVPDAVSGEKDAVETYTDEDGNEQTRIKPQGVDTSFLVATLTAAIQELKAVVDTQAAEIAALKTKVGA